MEDTYLAGRFKIRVEHNERNNRVEVKELDVNITAVFDGHGGKEWADYTKNSMIESLQRSIHIFNASELTNTNIYNALKIAFSCLNWNAKNQEQYPAQSLRSGTTANVALMIDGVLWLANVGDSSAILVDPATGVAERITEDAKPDFDKYRQSVEARGGKVIVYWSRSCLRMVNRVQGRLAFATALGDNEEPFNGSVAPVPEVTRIGPDEYKGKTLVQVSDGILDVMTVSDIGKIVQDTCTAEEAATRLVKAALELLSQDNMTALGIV